MYMLWDVLDFKMVCTWRVQDEGGRPQRGRSPCCGLWDWPEPGLATPPDSQTSSVSGDWGEQQQRRARGTDRDAHSSRST